jgi:hypothetical protein
MTNDEPAVKRQNKNPAMNGRAKHFGAMTPTKLRQRPVSYRVISTVAPVSSVEDRNRGEAEESALSTGLLTEKADLSGYGRLRPDESARPFDPSTGFRAGFFCSGQALTASVEVTKGDQPLSIEIIGNTMVSTLPTNSTCTPENMPN